MNYESAIPSSEISMMDDPVQRAANRRPLIIAAAVAVALLLAYIGYNYFFGAKGDEEVASQAPMVTVMAPGKQQITRTINATGTVAARREIPVSIVGEGGRVTNVYVDAGDWVKQGQIMASIDRSVQSQQAAGLEASVGVSRADLNLAQANLDRAAQLVDRGFISKADIDRLTATRDSAAARLRVAQAQLNETRARNNRLNVVAPKAGFVLERNVEPGQTVTQGSGVLFLLAQNGEMELQAQLGEADLANISVGISTQVTPVGTDKNLTGQVWQISPTIDPQSRQGIAKIALGYDPALRPGGFASARIESGTSEVAVLPESALQNDSKGSFVYIVGADNKAVRRDVVIGATTAAGISVTSGLNGNERVVLRAGGFLSPGETVQPKVQKKAGGA
ncbi:efflux RND transporter periplasmic adaptor subunit [Parasphingorhabdus flavimaris]|jgi:HlyD family secretion protein|uniref:Efflux RND transporter periplasmic adaptor subunit n=1 Tax=Parasphingorhabdus flavimaris TaxID=266812 RepID=A0ABX2N790_9SPHN|nr:efflux RND transporter periplasmic adaptor subunit [Parasphingorhabdus flavimaris]NVD29411.1 efflux RND transporter periplasmic adaptor subunit [Parasphingorhabdus flavimaris]|tara:strand:- start:13326 stop:14504 length:1179 start_codon:yes stop_codon:yes gene_type:complete